MSFAVSLKRAVTMSIRAAFLFCISFLASPTLAQNCTGKLIVGNVCIPKQYTNRFSQSAPNQAENVSVDLQQVTLLDINPKENKILVHINFFMLWVDNRLELQNNDFSDYFGLDDAVNLWMPTYRIKRYVHFQLYYSSSLLEEYFSFTD